MRTSSLRIALAVALLAAISLSAQDDTTAFEVVSIKPAPPVRRQRSSASLQSRPGRVRAAAITARGLISAAFPTEGVPRLPSRIAGGPDWVHTQQFEFIGITTGALSEDAITEHLPRLLRRALEDRFRLRGHLEMRPVPIYVLVPARRTATLGPLLRPANPRSDPWSASGPEYISAINMTMGALASRLTGLDAAGRVVLDRTGLAGGFDVDLYWSPARTLVTGAAPPEVDGASLFTAVQEQLGLKLQPRTELQDVYVVDHIEQPTPN